MKTYDDYIKESKKEKFNPRIITLEPRIKFIKPKSNNKLINKIFYKKVNDVTYIKVWKW